MKVLYLVVESSFYTTSLIYPVVKYKYIDVGNMQNYSVVITEKCGMPAVFQHFLRHWQTLCQGHKTTVRKKIVKEQWQKSRFYLIMPFIASHLRHEIWEIQFHTAFQCFTHRENISWNRSSIFLVFLQRDLF